MRCSFKRPPTLGSTCSPFHDPYLCERFSEDEPQVDFVQFPNLSQHQREVAECMAQRLGDQTLANLLSFLPKQHVPPLEQFEKLVLGKRMYASEARSHEVAESISMTHDELPRE